MHLDIPPTITSPRLSKKALIFFTIMFVEALCVPHEVRCKLGILQQVERPLPNRSCIKIVGAVFILVLGGDQDFCKLHNSLLSLIVRYIIANQTLEPTGVNSFAALSYALRKSCLFFKVRSVFPILTQEIKSSNALICVLLNEASTAISANLKSPRDWKGHQGSSSGGTSGVWLETPNSSNLCSRSGQQLRGWNSVLNSFGQSIDILEVPPAGRDRIDVSDTVADMWENERWQLGTYWDYRCDRVGAGSRAQDCLRYVSFRTVKK